MLAPCALPPLMSCASPSTGPIGELQRGMVHLRIYFCGFVTVPPLSSVAGSLVVSLSDGTLTLLEPDQTGQLVSTNTWAAHAHEPWCVAWDYWDTNVIYSGACILHSLRTNTF